MKKYFEYMDGVEVSDTLHQRLLNLETPKKRPAWKKYGTAAALALVVGAGGFAAWAAHINGLNSPIPFYPAGYQQTQPETADIGQPAQPDIATEEPGGDVEPGMKTIGGYEVTQGGVTTYHVLPYIGYGSLNGDVMQACLDWDVPPGSVKRDLTQADIAALLGGKDALSTHLDWGGYQLSGWAAWYGDGSFWGAYINGHAGPLDHFEFAVTADSIPPACIVYGDAAQQEIWGLAVTAGGHDSVATPSGGVDASERQITFMKDGYGYRLDITGVSRALTEERVSRLVRLVAVDKGLALDAITSDGAVLAHPYEADPGYSVGEPNWEDSASDYDPDCPYCADGTAHTHPYDPD